MLAAVCHFLSNGNYCVGFRSAAAIQNATMFGTLSNAQFSIYESCSFGAKINNNAVFNVRLSPVVVCVSLSALLCCSIITPICGIFVIEASQRINNNNNKTTLTDEFN